MTPDMSVNEMLDRFIYIVKGARVIDRKATDWGAAYWLDEKYVRHMVYSTSDLRNYFKHRRTKWNDPVNDWFKHPRRMTAATLSGAMKLADMAARGLVAPHIDASVGLSAPPWERKATAA